MSKVRNITIIGLALLMATSAAFAQEAKADKSEDKSKKKGTLTLIGQLQVRGATVAGDSSKDYQDFNYYVSRARFGGKYTSADKLWGAFLYDKWENDRAGDTSTPATVYTNAWIKPMDMLTIQFGDYKIPFNRENQRSSVRMFVDGWGAATSPVLRAVDTDDNDKVDFPKGLKTEMFDTGINAKLKPMKGLCIQVNMSNGAGAGITGEGDRKSSAYDNGTPLWTTYISYQALGKGVKHGMEPFADGMGLNIGIGGGYTSHYEIKSVEDWMGYTADFAFYASGFVLNGNFAMYNATDQTAAENDLEEMGYMVETGYNHDLGSWSIMPAVRYESKVFDVDGAETTTSTIKAGLNSFFAKHNSKLSIFYSQKDVDNGTSKSDNVLEFQYQTFFAHSI